MPSHLLLRAFFPPPRRVAKPAHAANRKARGTKPDFLFIYYVLVGIMPFLSKNLKNLCWRRPQRKKAVKTDHPPWVSSQMSLQIRLVMTPKPVIKPTMMIARINHSWAF